MDKAKLDLYNKAKEAYYSGSPIMNDYDFDELEKELGLENKSYIGSKHNPSYTVKHPFIMGSLSKVQIKEDANGAVDWSTYLSDIKKYVGSHTCIVSPKYDGCSFEALVKDGKILSISTRGDGEYGKDIKDHIHGQVAEAIKNLRNNELCLRGEVLIDKDIFVKKYSEFINPRSFVAGILNRKYEGIGADEVDELNGYCKDLSIVIYDIRVKLEDGWHDYDFDMVMKDQISFMINDKHIDLGFIENEFMPDTFAISGENGIIDLQQLYEKFAKYREECRFALDGFVVKPTDEFRNNNLTDRRPKDCVAVKFIPMLEETEVVDIKWQLGKTGEYTPVVITKPVIMDGKSVTKASGHNYDNLVKNKIAIGTKLILSLAGDIIPFIYKVTDTAAFSEDNINKPDNTYLDGCHLMAILSEEEQKKNDFICSAATLNIPSIGPAAANKIFDYINTNDAVADEFFESEPIELPTNILEVSPETVYFALGGKLGENARKAFKKVIKEISLKDIIKSCNFKFCGDRVSEQIAAYLTSTPYDFASMASEGWEWSQDEDSYNYLYMVKILNALNKDITDFKPTEAEVQAVSDKIPVILTGEPNDYASKGEFMRCHPEYRLTGSWKEVKIVFTNSLESNTGKMKKAHEKGIELKLY